MEVKEILVIDHTEYTAEQAKGIELGPNEAWQDAIDDYHLLEEYDYTEWRAISAYCKARTEGLAYTGGKGLHVDDEPYKRVRIIWEDEEQPAPKPKLKTVELNAEEARQYLEENPTLFLWDCETDIHKGRACGEPFDACYNWHTPGYLSSDYEPFSAIIAE